MARKSVISQLQTAGESVLGKVAENPTTRTALKGAMELKDRGERIVHGLESIDSRLAAIEKRLAALEGGAPRPRTRATGTAKRATGTAKSAAASPRKTKPRPAGGS